MAFIVFAKPIVSRLSFAASTLAPFAAIAWPWYVLIGTSITLIVGILSSFTHPMPATLPVVVMTVHRLGVDGGGTKTRVIVADEHWHQARRSRRTGQRVRPVRRALGDVITAAINDALASCEMTHVMPKVLCVGVAGAAREPERQALWQALGEREVAKRW
jgi:hypothetical protein